MHTKSPTKRKLEFGDFQTPPALARQVCALLSAEGLTPASIIEPTCGLGNFLLSALHQFPSVNKAVGLEINASYVNALKQTLLGQPYASKAVILHEDFFDADWPSILGGLQQPLLVVGNPPWVTNAALGVLNSSNLPDKGNFQNHPGLDAITGKSNFDISEWMLIQTLNWLEGREGTLAMLCKTAVARKVLWHAWKNKMHLGRSHMYPIDAQQHFGASVEACLLVCQFSPSAQDYTCLVHSRFAHGDSGRLIGYVDDLLIADLDRYQRWGHLKGQNVYRWRSGIKHDCAKVMELQRKGAICRNGLGELVDIEDDYLYPMLKSSEIANGCGGNPTRWMLVTQRSVGSTTLTIREAAPKTWRYLEGHAELLDQRASSIYKGRPRFSIFGVGEYSFALWKVAISGFYKRLDFKVIGPFMGKPVVLDDTSYFLSCESREEAEHLASILNSQLARNFFEAFIFWDAKRPITADLLDMLDLTKLSRELGAEVALKSDILLKSVGTRVDPNQISLFAFIQDAGIHVD
jgi:hypothetical protein